ncbi:Mini-ribonuclease 3 [Prochlorococcus sp. MIT 1341]|uniref:Mini-ribonuclease 3 n=1 Tax=Prochlorococcus sp. MIT 1341 TaxID=3096221 RepID=UPI002A75ECE1|nr:ribonuclease III domain-containing protein [Prochlorococcus sp. MIT 1341]
MSKWLRNNQPFGCPDDLGPLQLAWLGDSVWELHQRLRHCQKPGRTMDLHLSVVSEVRAGAQVLALKRLEPHLNEFEKELVRRGRNKAGRGPRNADAADYGKATGFETMVGWLFLKDPSRLAQLLDQLDEA